MPQKMNILKDSNKYYFFNSTVIENELKPKEYLFNFDSFGNCFLEDIEEFKTPSKIYDVDKELRENIHTSFNHYPKNLGCLLTGSKGMGKSLTAKLICNHMNLPIVVINKAIPISVNFVNFLNQIKQDYVLFVDEFEKLFSKNSDNEKEGFHNQEVFLSFMDGVLTNEHKILFLLTTNDAINQFFINRPSRIKFLVEYNELPEELFNLIVEDRLVNKEFKEDLEDNVSLVNLNIDLLISIIEDINLFNKPFSSFIGLYNYRFENYKYELYKIIDNVEKFGSFMNNGKRIKPSDTYIGGYHVHEMIKFTKDEIIFGTTCWEEDKKGKDFEAKCLIKIIPSKSGNFNNLII